LKVDILMTERIVKTLRTYDKCNNNPCTKLNKITVDGIDHIKFQWDRVTYKFSVNLQFTDPVTLMYSELLFRRVYVEMVKVFEAYSESR